MNVLNLKLIALVTMIIDHLGAVFFKEYFIFRYIGRLAFPLYAFLVSEGCKKTSNFFKYLTRLFIFAVISEPFFDLAFNGSINFFADNNTIFTLFLASLMIYIFKNLHIQKFIKILAGVLILFLSEWINTDYSSWGIFIVLIFYFLERKTAIIFAALLILINGIDYNLSYFLTTGQVYTRGVMINFMTMLSLIFIYFYNGEKGVDFEVFGVNFFYWAYPLHLVFIVMVERFLK